MQDQKVKTIDPRTTRRRILQREWDRNRALYAKYELVDVEHVLSIAGDQHWAVIQLKPEWCVKSP